MTKTFYYTQPFSLESGTTLPGFHITYTTLGALNTDGSNVIWVFHALTANSNPLEWWSGLIGDDKLFDPLQYFIVCVNMPGSCYGSLSPLDNDPVSSQPYYHAFPQFTTRDMIRCYQYLREALEIQSVYIGIGGSMGGQQLLEWAIDEPTLFQYIIPIATNAKHSAWGIAFNAAQRFCIESDPTWPQQNAQAGIDGMKTARAIAMLSYRNYISYTTAQTGWHETQGLIPTLSKAETYQHYQGEKLSKRFNAFSYYFLSRSMDLHDVSRGRISIDQALQKIQASALVIGIASDVLFPITEQEELAALIPDAKLVIIDSLYGHDGFLLEYEKIANSIKQFLPAKKSTYTFTSLL